MFAWIFRVPNNIYTTINFHLVQIWVYETNYYSKIFNTGSRNRCDVYSIKLDTAISVRKHFRAVALLCRLSYYFFFRKRQTEPTLVILSKAFYFLICKQINPCKVRQRLPKCSMPRGHYSGIINLHDLRSTWPNMLHYFVFYYEILYQISLQNI